MRKRFIWLVLYYLRFWAQIALWVHQPKIIGITGSVGKSSARNAITAVLKDHFRIKTIEKGNSETGVPLGILGLTVSDYSPFDWIKLLFQAPFRLFYLKDAEYLIIEMGIDEPHPPKNMGFLLTIVKPDIAVFLNTYPVHTMQFAPPSHMQFENDRARLEWIVRRIAAEKGRIITESGCKVGIYNIDNQYVNEVIASYELGKKNQSQILFSFGKDETNTVHFGRYEVNLDGSMFTFYVNWNEKKESILIKTNNYVLPQEYQEIFASAIVVGKYTGLSNYQITQSLQKNYTVPKSRSSLLSGIQNSVIIDSSYNASKAAVIAFLKMAYELKLKEKRPLVFIFGDMRELGDQSQIEHEAVTEEILKTVDCLYCVGELTEKYVMPKVNTLKESMHFANSVKAGVYLKDNLPQRALVLVKGSQNTIFLEEAVKQLLKNKEDEKKLCRQDAFWIKKKKHLYTSSE